MPLSCFPNYRRHFPRPASTSSRKVIAISTLAEPTAFALASNSTAGPVLPTTAHRSRFVWPERHAMSFAQLTNPRAPANSCLKIQPSSRLLRQPKHAYGLCKSASSRKLIPSVKHCWKCTSQYLWPLLTMTLTTTDRPRANPIPLHTTLSSTRNNSASMKKRGRNGLGDME